MTKEPSPASGGDALEQLHQALVRLHREWKAVSLHIGLTSNSSFSEVAELLQVDRGTAHRLVHLMRLEAVDVTGIHRFPGVRAWARVVVQVRKRTGARSQVCQRLADAVTGFGDTLRQTGGSKQGAIRRVRDGNISIPSGDTATALHDSKADDALTFAPSPHAPVPQQADQAGYRRLWVEAAAACIGYSVATRLELTMLNRSAQDPNRADLTLVNAFLDCTGRLGAAPFALGSYSFNDKHEVTVRPEMSAPDQVHVLKSLTSEPMPEMLFSRSETSQSVVVQPDWFVRPTPSNLSVLVHRPGSMEGWPPEKWIEMSMGNRHPARRLIIERHVPKEVDEEFNVFFNCYRVNMPVATGGSWFDRLSESAAMQRLGTAREAMDLDPIIPRYRDVVAESYGHVQQSPDDLIAYRIVIDYPVPLAKYVVLFERKQPLSD